MNGVMGNGQQPMQMPPQNRGPPQNQQNRGPPPNSMQMPVGGYAPRRNSGPPPPGPPPHMRSNRPDINVARGPPASKNPRRRPEMKGPSDISDILSGIKKKTVNIQSNKKDSGSTISIEDLKELHTDNLDMPRKSRRKPKSARNTISLNI